jgi:hypothetical protein
MGCEWEYAMKKDLGENKRRYVCQDGEYQAVTVRLHDLRVWKTRAASSAISVVVLTLWQFMS